MKGNPCSIDPSCQQREGALPFAASRQESLNMGRSSDTDYWSLRVLLAQIGLMTKGEKRPSGSAQAACSLATIG